MTVGILNHFFLFHDLDVLQCRRAGDRMVPVAMEVLENIDRLGHISGAFYCSQGDISAGYPFGYGYDVPFNTEVLDTEPFPRPAEPADDLIDDEQDSVSVANLTYDLPVLGRWRISPEPLQDRLSNESGNLFRVFKLYDPLHIPRAGDIAGGIGG
jgi:hypothetical protein